MSDTTDTGRWDGARLQQLALDHLWMAYQPPVPYAAEGGPPIMVRGEGCWLWDTNGKRYLDGVSALEAAVIGHGRQELVAAAREQMEAMAFLDVFRYTSPPAVLLAAKLAELAPGDLSRVHYSPGGSEAVEVAIKVAKQYQRLSGHPERYKVITRGGAYHGCTFGAMAVDGDYFSTEPEMYGPLLPIRVVVPSPDHPRCRWCNSDCTSACLQEVEQIILRENAETIAAMIVDPCGTASAVSIPPPDYMPQLEALCRRYGVLLIVDEIITGFGRTGRMFACEHWGITPDLMTISKGLSSGYIPIGATLVSERIARVFIDHPDGRLSHGQTYGGHPVACAVALANIGLIQREGLAQRAAERGVQLLQGLRRLRHHRAFIDARGLGLLIGLEVDYCRASGSPVGDPNRAGLALRSICRDQGLVTLTLHPGNVLLLSPPLTITTAEVDSLVDMVDRALALYETQYL